MLEVISVSVVCCRVRRLQCDLRHQLTAFEGESVAISEIGKHLSVLSIRYCCHVIPSSRRLLRLRLRARDARGFANAVTSQSGAHSTDIGGYL